MPPLDSNSRKLRVLCLHSWRTSARIFKLQWQRSGLYEQLSDLLELVRVCGAWRSGRRRARAGNRRRQLMRGQRQSSRCSAPHNTCLLLLFSSMWWGCDQQPVAAQGGGGHAPGWLPCSTPRTPMPTKQVFITAPNPASGPIPGDVAGTFEGPFFEWFSTEKAKVRAGAVLLSAGTAALVRHHSTAPHSAAQRVTRAEDSWRLLPPVRADWPHDTTQRARAATHTGWPGPGLHLPQHAQERGGHHGRHPQPRAL
jgi:hypothetical protein